MAAALPVGELGEYSEEEGEFNSPAKPAPTVSSDSPATTRGSSSASGMTDAQDRRLRILEDKVNAVTDTAGHLLSTQSEMVDSIAALRTQSAGFAKSHEATTNTLAMLAENMAKLVAVAGLTAASPVPTPAPVIPPQVVVPQEPHGTAPGCGSDAFVPF